MKNSAFSPCPLHTSQEIAYFCLENRCFQALCRDCLAEHPQTHKKLEKIDAVSLKCKAKLEKTLQILAQKTEAFLKESPLISHQSFFEESWEKIQRAEQLFLEEISRFFQSFKENYAKLMAPLLENDAKSTQIFEKIQNFSNRLHYYFAKLEANGRNLDVLQRVCALNLKEITRKAFQDLDCLRKPGKFEEFGVYCNENALKQLESLTKSFIFLEKSSESAISLEVSKAERAILPYFPANLKEIRLWSSESADFSRNPLENVPNSFTFHQTIANASENLVYFLTEREIFLYESPQSVIIPLETLKFPRFHYALSLFHARNLLVIGGVPLQSSKKCSKACEMYDFHEKRVVSLQELVIPLAFANACNFKEKYVYLFGGITEDFQPSQRIFRLKLEKNVWENVDPCVDFGFDLKSFKVNCTNHRSLQANREEIVIFSGNFQENAETFVFNVKNNEISRIKRDFWRNCAEKLEFYGEPVVFMRNVYVLAKDEEKSRVFLCIFDSDVKEWTVEVLSEENTENVYKTL